MKKFLGLLIIMFIILITNVGAASSGGNLEGKQNDCITIPQECADCTYINLTSIQYPNLSRTHLNIEMTMNGTSFNYEFCDTSEIGDYNYCVVGDVEGEATVTCKPFKVSPAGFTTTTFYMIILLISLIIIFLGYYVEDAWIVILGSFGLVFVGLFILFYGIAGIKDTVYTQSFAIIIMMLGGYFGIKGSLEKIDN